MDSPIIQQNNKYREKKHRNLSNKKMSFAPNTQDALLTP